MEIYRQLLLLAEQPHFHNESRVLRQAAFELMPASLRLQFHISNYAGETALVSDVVEALGLRANQSVGVGKALSKLGYTRKMIAYDSKVYPLWVKKECRYPKFELHNILERRRLAKRKERRQV